MEQVCRRARQWGITLSPRTARRYLACGAIRYRRKYVPRLFLRNMCARERWAMLMVRSKQTFLASVWSDEKLFVLDPGRGGADLVHATQREDHRRLRPHSGRNAIRIMAFGLFAFVLHQGEPSGVGEIVIVPSGADGSVTAEVCYHVLNTHVAPFMAKLGGRRFLLEDNASAHRACGNLPLPFNRVQHGNYPAHSPDFNAIERLWAVTDSMVRKRLSEVEADKARDVVYLQKLISKCFRNACVMPAGLRAIEWAWSNLLYAAANNGKQRPTA